jgi:uncharacterized protein
MWNDEPDISELRRLHGELSTNPEQAVAGLKALAGRGSAMSMVYVANAYRKGVGAPIDLQQSTEWYRRAAAAGSIPASYELGRNLLEAKQYDEARTAFATGVAQEYSPSMNVLAGMYMSGDGVPINLQEARRLLESAASQGHVFAKRNLASLLMKGHFGILQVPRGVFLFLSGLGDLVRLAPRDRLNDRLR